MAINYTALKTNDGTYYGKKINAIVNALRSLSLNSGRGYKIHQTPLGTTLDITPGKGGAPSTPFTAHSAGRTDSDNAYLIRVTEGIINADIEPTTIGGHEDTDLLFSVPDLATRWIYLKAHLTGEGLVDLAEIRCEAEVPTTEAGDPETGAPPAYSYRALAKVVHSTEDGLEITNYLTGSQWVSVIVSNWNCQEIIRNVVWS